MVATAVVTCLALGIAVGGSIGAITTHAAFSFYIRHSRWRNH